jgi:hypothetical protein
MLNPPLFNIYFPILPEPLYCKAFTVPLGSTTVVCPYAKVVYPISGQQRTSATTVPSVPMACVTSTIPEMNAGDDPTATAQHSDLPLESSMVKPGASGTCLTRTQRDQ